LEITMLMAHSTPHDARWDPLQQPAHPSAVDPHYRVLLAALDLGWQIEEPVYLLPRWADSGVRVYHFILQRVPRGTPHLVTVPHGPQIDAFVQDAGLQVLTNQA
jgi:hypothetical protein